MGRSEGLKKGKEKAKETFEMEDDSIGFDPSSEDDSGALSGDKEHDWDEGKRRASERVENLGSAKRKHDRIYDEDGQRRATTFQRAPWAADIDWRRCRNVSEILHLEVEAFVNYISPTPVEHEVRWAPLLLALRRVIHMSQLIFLDKVVYYAPVSTDVHYPYPVYCTRCDQRIKGGVAAAEDYLTQEIEAMLSMMPGVSLNNSFSYLL